jgi:hypothetical protein
MFENLDDPKTQFLLMAGLGLLGGAPGQRKNFGADIAHAGLLGMQGYGQAKTQQARDAERKQAQEMRDLQMAELKRASTDREGLRSAFQASMTPAQTTQPDPYEFDQMGQGSPMPAPTTRPAGFDQQAFLGKAAPFMDPMQAVQFQQQLANANRPDLMVLPEGATAIDRRRPNAGPVATGAPKLPTGMRMGANGPEYIPEYLKGQEQISAARRPQISLSANMPPLEKKEQADKGSLNVKNFGDLQGTATAARREIALLTGLEKLNLDTTALTPANATVSAWVAALGGGKQFQQAAAQGQGFTAFTKDLVLQRQLAQKGPQTEYDARRLEQTMPQLGNQAEANKLVMNFAIAQNQRIVDQERFYADWWKKNKTYEGADEAWFSGKGGTSLWDEPRLKKFQTSGGGVTLRFDANGNPI